MNQDGLGTGLSHEEVIEIYIYVYITRVQECELILMGRV